MAFFKVSALNASGKKQTLFLESSSLEIAQREIENKGMILLEIQETAERHEEGFSLLRRDRIDAVEFSDSLAPLLNAGITLERSLVIMEQTSDDDHYKLFLKSLYQGLHEGRSFSDLISNYPKDFPPVYVTMLKVGEEAGLLAEVVDRISHFMNEQKKIKSFLISSSVYPALIMAVSVFVVVFLLGYVIPKFGTVFSDRSGDLSFATTALLAVSDFCSSYWWLIISTPVALAIGLVALCRRERFRAWLDKKILDVPFFGSLVRLKEVSVFMETLGVLIHSGVHLINSVHISRHVIRNQSIRKSLADVTSQLRKGEKLSTALEKSPHIPPLALRLLAVGEETGNMEGMMEKVAERYTTEFRDQVQRVLSLFEPFIIVVLGGIIGVIIVTMFISISEVGDISLP